MWGVEGGANNMRKKKNHFQDTLTEETFAEETFASKNKREIFGINFRE